MKKYCWIICFVFFALAGNSQKHDYNWMAGYRGTVDYDTFYHHYFGISKFDFEQNPVGISHDSVWLNFSGCNSIISDTDGNLLFYCNGITINNRFNEKVENGDSLGVINNYFLLNLSSSLYWGVPFSQYQVILPNPQNSLLYDLFYVFVDTFQIPNGSSLDGKRVLRATIDIGANNGKGRVSRKDSTVLIHENNIEIAANKHGNGRDWWLVTYKTFTNCYSIMLYNGSDSITTVTQCGGGQADRGNYMLVRFSPDGNTFVTASQKQGLAVFDFDRCTGLMNLREQVYIPELEDSQWFVWGLEFSDNGRFVYLSATYELFQFDIQATSIAASKAVVGEYNSTHRCPFNQYFTHLQRGPDGKIYMNGGNTNYCIGLIANPNEQGLACNFNDTAIDLPTFIDGLPYYPNYRLGALPGSPCDTLTGLNELARAEKEKILKLYPNPTSDFVTIDYGFTDWNKGEVMLEITNTLGQVVYNRELPMYSGLQKIDVHTYTAGFYTAHIKRNGQVVATGKFVRE